MSEEKKVAPNPNPKPKPPKPPKRKLEQQPETGPLKKRWVDREHEESSDSELDVKDGADVKDGDVDMKAVAPSLKTKKKECDVMIDGKSRFFVYIIETEQKKPDFAYVGFTFENEWIEKKRKHGMSMRLAQHNGVISGGAPHTSKHRPLRVIATLTGDPSWFHKRHARYVETCLQRLAPREFVRQAKWRDNPSSLSARYRKRYKDFPPPPPLSLLKVRGHSKASRQLNLLTFFLHNFGLWPIRDERSPSATNPRNRRGRRRSSAPVDSRSGRDAQHQIDIALHEDFWDADTIRSIEQTCRYWSPHFVPLVLDPFVSTRVRKAR